MGLFDFLFKKKEDSFDSGFEEYCENCGELLEDCECNDKLFSKQDISQEELFILEDEEEN